MPCPISLEDTERMLASVPEAAVEQIAKEISKAQRLRIDTAISLRMQPKSAAVLVLAQ